MAGLCTSYSSITGYVLLGLLIFGYAIATKSILRISVLFPRSWLNYLNKFTFFYWSHMVMAISFVSILLVHPLPSLPKLDTPVGSITWVRSCIIYDLLSSRWQLPFFNIKRRTNGNVGVPCTPNSSLSCASCPSNVQQSTFSNTYFIVQSTTRWRC